MRKNLCITLSALAALLACGLASERVSARQSETVETTLTVPEPSNPPPTPPALVASGQTYLLSASADQTIGASVWPLVEPAPGGAGAGGGTGAVVVTFVPASNTPVTFQASSLPEADIQVMWTLSLGSAFGTDGVSVPAGALRADVQHTRNVDGQTVCTTLTAVSLLPLELAQEILLGLGADPTQPVDPFVRKRFCLGTSCVCPRCDDGVLFAAPFFIIGNCNAVTGDTCCQQGCTIACQAYRNGNSLAESWVIGQGQFVVCMLVHTPD